MNTKMVVKLLWLVKPSLEWIDANLIIVSNGEWDQTEAVYVGLYESVNINEI